MSHSLPYHPIVVLSSNFLCILSIFTIVWSLAVFYWLSDVLLMTDTDVINACILLSGLLMIPSNSLLLCSIANNITISINSRVACCPLWMYIAWIILVNFMGACCCIRRIYNCKCILKASLLESMSQYRSSPIHKRFIDNLQWALKCCGMRDYRDWFVKDWYDKIRDYEWEPSLKKRLAKTNHLTTDSVPLSCCKTGSCISNYLTELGTSSINTQGCFHVTYRFMMIFLTMYTLIFLINIIAQLILLRYIYVTSESIQYRRRNSEHQIKPIMSAKMHFRHRSSESAMLDDTDDDSCG